MKRILPYGGHGNASFANRNDFPRAQNLTQSTGMFYEFIFRDFFNTYFVGTIFFLWTALIDDVPSMHTCNPHFGWGSLYNIALLIMSRLEDKALNN
jgi:hypothetical protein